MSSRWDAEGRLNQLLDDMSDLALAIRVGSYEMTDGTAYRILRGAAELAGEAASVERDWPHPDRL